MAIIFSFYSVSRDAIELYVPIRSVGKAFLVQVVHAFKQSPDYTVISSGFMTVPGGWKPLVSCASAPFKVVEFSSYATVSSSLFKSVSSIVARVSIISVAHFVGEARTVVGPASVTAIGSGVAMEGGIVDGAIASSFKFFDGTLGAHRPLVLWSAVAGAPTERTVKVCYTDNVEGDEVEDEVAT